MDVPGLGQWMWAFGLLSFFAWVVLDAFTEILPWHMIEPTNPNRTALGVALMVITGGLALVVLQDLMQWVWMGLKHLLLIDVLESEIP